MKAELAVDAQIELKSVQLPDVLWEEIFNIPLVYALHFLHLVSAYVSEANP